VKQLAILLGVMLLDWAALHDIHAGEPDVWMEWSILGLSGLAFALLLWKALSLRRRDRA
jgi:hypothetical protein